MGFKRGIAVSSIADDAMMEAGEAWQEEQDRKLPTPLYLGMPGTIQYDGTKLPKTI
jgi:hypothetical protein